MGACFRYIHWMGSRAPRAGRAGLEALLGTGTINNGGSAVGTGTINNQRVGRGSSGGKLPAALIAVFNGARADALRGGSGPEAAPSSRAILLVLLIQLQSRSSA